MFRRIVALFAVAVMAFSFASCSSEPVEESLYVTGAPLPAEPSVSYIAKEVAAKYEMKSIYSYADKEFTTFEYNGKNVLARIESSGNVCVLFEYPLDMEIIYDIEATKRSGNYLYFTKRDKGAAYASLCAIYMPTCTQITIIDTPCSNMVTLDTKSTTTMYPYGIIATRNQLAVIDLAKGVVSTTYSKAPVEIRLFVDMGDAFFKSLKNGAYTETMLERVDEKHIMVNIIEKDKNGETTNEINFTFNPSNGVASL